MPVFCTVIVSLDIYAGLAPELVGFNAESDMQAGSSPSNQLRPEVLESFFYMWRFTGDPVYQKWAWQVFQSFEKYCRVEAGYAGLEVCRDEFCK